MPAKKTTPSRVSVFLDAYAVCGSVTAAAKAAGVHRTTHYLRAKKDPDYRSAVAIVEEHIGQQIEDACVTRAIHGSKRQLFWRGKPMKAKNGHLIYKVEYDTDSTSPC